MMMKDQEMKKKDKEVLLKEKRIIENDEELEKLRDKNEEITKDAKIFTNKTILD